jgi:hypothetical protein
MFRRGNCFVKGGIEISVVPFRVSGRGMTAQIASFEVVLSVSFPWPKAKFTVAWGIAPGG